MYTRTKRRVQTILGKLKHEKYKLGRVRSEPYGLRIMSDSRNFGKDLTAVKLLEYTKNSMLVGFPLIAPLYLANSLYEQANREMTGLLLPSLLFTCVSIGFTFFDLQDPSIVIPKLGSRIAATIEELHQDHISLRRKLYSN